MDEQAPVGKSVNKTVHSTVDKIGMAENEHLRLAAQKKRSNWLALLLFGFVLLIGATSAFQLKKNIQRNSNANTGVTNTLSEPAANTPPSVEP